MWLHSPETLSPVLPEEQRPGCLPTFRLTPHCPTGCGLSTFPHLTPPPRKASLRSMALPEGLLVVFTSIANGEEAAGAQSQSLSLLQNMRTWGHRVLPVPWERPEMQRWNSSCPFSQGLGLHPHPISGVLGSESASSAQGTNTVVRGRQARPGVTPGRHQLAQSTFLSLILTSSLSY